MSRLNASTVALCYMDDSAQKVALYRVARADPGDILDLTTAFASFGSASCMPGMTVSVGTTALFGNSANDALAQFIFRTGAAPSYLLIVGIPA